MDKDLAEHLAVLADFSKKIPVETEKLRLVEHDIVKKKLAITNQTTVKCLFQAIYFFQFSNGIKLSRAFQNAIH